MKKIVIAAGTGFLGQILANYFQDKVTTIIILTREQNKNIGNINYVHWNAQTLGDWKNHIDGADVLINMAGKSVDCRYHQKNKDLILYSRIKTTQILGKAVMQSRKPPKIWLNSSTATIYKHSLDKEMNEISGEIGTGFSVNVATAWENTFFSQHTPQTRKVALRTAIVLGKNGGALPPLLNLVKIGFGGKQGKGNQKFSWIHEKDFARSIEFIIQNPSIQGVINLVSPKPTTNTLFMNTLQKTLQVPIGIPLPKLILKIGARIINTETELILKSRNVIPKKLIENGFRYQFPNLKNAVTNILSK